MVGLTMVDRYTIVTGAASGIGRATSLRLVQEGHEVLGLDIDSTGLAETAAACQGPMTVATVDLADRAQIESIFTRLVAQRGAPGVLVNNAGIGVAATLLETTDADWDRMLAVNLSAPFSTCRAVLPSMIEAGGGVIVNVSSVAGIVGLSRRAAYCATKAGLLGLTRAMAADHAAQGLRVNAICPGTVHTEWIGKILADAPDPERTRAAMEQRQLNGRMGTPEEVAAGIAFLVGPDATFVNGSAFVMDGGLTAV